MRRTEPKSQGTFHDVCHLFNIIVSCHSLIRLTRQGADGRTQVDFNVHYQAPNKRKRKKRYLVAKTSLSLQALSKLKGTENCKCCKMPLYRA